VAPEPPAARDDALSDHHHRVIDDLAIIQAQTQLMLRQLAAGKPIDRIDTERRHNVVLEAVRRLTLLHR